MTSVAFLIGSSLVHSYAAEDTVIAGSTQSISKQFTIVGGDQRLRSSAANFAEGIRAVWLEASGLPTKWEFPINIYFPESLRNKPRQGIAVNFLYGDGDSLRLRLTIWEPSMIGTPEAAEWIFQALIGEFSARTTPPPLNRPFQMAPPWLVQALVQQWSNKKEPLPIHLLEGLLNGKKPPTVASLLHQRNFTGSITELTTFRLMAFGLLRTLLEQPNGKDGFRKLCSLLETTDINQEAVLTSFPSLGGSIEKLERQWVLTLARLSYGKRTELLSLAETSNQLEKLFAMECKMPAKKQEEVILRGPEAMLGIGQQQGGPRELMAFAGRLNQLEIRANPLLQSVIREYREIAMELAKHPKSNLRKRIEKNQELAMQLQKLGTAINDELNTFSVNRVGTPDPAFQQMLRAQKSATTPPPREDAISRALDAYDAFSNP